MKRGIYLVANQKSEMLCENLVYSIRSTGCTLPIRLIHFGGAKIKSKAILDEVEFLEIEGFSHEALEFLSELQKILTWCPCGFLNRFLAFFSDWDEFIYSDNDVVALRNWEELFEFPAFYNIVHADREYLTNGKYNFYNPGKVNNLFGQEALDAAFTAGHFLVRKNEAMIKDMRTAIEWFGANTGIAKQHDQAFLHISALIGKWNILNLCKPPNNWLTSWAGDYKNSLSLIQATQSSVGGKISHLHYSGETPEGLRAIEDLLLSNKGNKHRLKSSTIIGLKYHSGFFYMKMLQRKLKKKLRTYQFSKIKFV